MDKQAFIEQLRGRLSGLSREDMERSIEFYSEMVDDRMEEGLTEEEAVAQIGSVREVVDHIMAEIPLSKLVKEKGKSRRGLRAWEILLLVLGSPVWLSLLIAAFAVVWSVIISLWAIEGSLWGCALGGVAAGILFALNGNGLAGIALIGAGLVCTGLSILLFYGCKAATKGTLLLAKKLTLGIQNRFVKREEA